MMPTTAVDHFERLGLPRRFSVDLHALEQAYLARSRQVHPDFHTGTSPADQAYSLEASARLNEAYLALREPFRRGEYLLGLLGGPKPHEEKNLDQAFLMEMMELREQLEEARANQLSLTALEDRIQTDLDGMIQAIAATFANLERTAVTPPDKAVLSQIRRLLNSAKTLQSLQRDLCSD